MAIASKFNGKCKDCKTPHNQGDMIDQNNNGNWCILGKRCSGSKPNDVSTPNMTTSTMDQTIIDKQQLVLDCVTCMLNIMVDLKLAKLEDIPESIQKLMAGEKNV